MKQNSHSTRLPSRRKTGESGNVLFLILIAVALFAALSYAVTQSSRSGSGDANSEKSLVSGAEVTQYPAGVRTAIVRMVISNNVSVDQLYFDDPSTFANDFPNGAGTPADPTVTGDQKRAVFHPAGGGATYQPAPAEIMASNTAGTWYFNALFQVPNIGVTTTAGGGDPSGNDLIAFLPGVKQSICQKIDDSLGLPAIPVLTTAPVAADVKFNQDKVASATTAAFPTTGGVVMGTDTGEIAGQPFACFQTTGGDYVYYHVLVER